MIRNQRNKLAIAMDHRNDDPFGLELDLESEDDIMFDPGNSPKASITTHDPKDHKCEAGMTELDGYIICKHCGTNLRKIK